ncbi:tape measure protein [Brachyspira hyodysenteriae]|uniref:tape measure protein n=1 Tax=Brachyspira hyodysenteriae TaxID=159 RepID=UPI00063D8F56|nr:tape measure protein [Brachyspira hyodysenteriae]KLI46158.1 hypothetical protein SZ41_12380 [Brachyspira hyodysenteriae]KLI53601.1 hypothetical protein SZ42_00485 [Brachyspira hyodysenteriae]
MAIGSDVLNVAVIFSAIDRLTRPVSRMTTGMNKLQQQIYYADRYMQDMFIKTSIAATGIIAVTKQMVDAFAWTETALANMTTALNGDIEKADNLLTKIRDMAANSPLTAKPLVNSANVLLSYGIEEDKIMDTLQRLGDLSKGRDEVLESLAMGYGRIVAENRVTREHLDRFVFKGNIPIYKALAKTMGISEVDLAKEMQAGRVTGEHLIAAVNNLTDKGGEFYKAMEKLTATFEGQSQQFAEKFDLVLGSIGQVITPFLTRALMVGFNPLLEVMRGKINSYLAPKVEYFRPENYSKTEDIERLRNRTDISNNEKAMIIEQLELGNIVKYVTDTKAVENIWKAFNKILDVLIPKNWDWLDKILENLENGTSLFYDFIDVIAAFINGVKFAFQSFIFILNILKQLKALKIVGFLAGVLAFFAPLAFVFIKIISLGQGLLSIFGGIINTIGLLASKLSLLSPIFNAILSPFSVIISKFSTVFSGLFYAVKGALAGIAGTVGIVIVAIAALSLVFGQLYKRFEWFRKFVDGFTGFLYNIADRLKELGGLFSWFGTAIQNFANVLRAFFQGDLLGILIALGKLILDFFMNMFYSVFGIIGHLIHLLIEKITEMLPDWAKEKLGFIGDIFKKITGFSESIQKELDRRAGFQEEKKKEEEKDKKEMRENMKLTVNNTNNINTNDPNTTVESETYFVPNVGILPNGVILQ